jgi:hypothetical protein
MTLTLAALAQTQTTIVISSGLSSRVDQLPVKVGTAWMGKIYKIKFGEYYVGESKMGWTITTQKAGILNRKTESSSKQKFSFELNGSSTEIALVNAVSSMDTEALREWTITSYSTSQVQVSLDTDTELLLQSNSFSAIITIDNDTTAIWTLIMTTFSGSKTDGHYVPIAQLSNGTRKIALVPVTSNDNGQDSRKIPALGYELMENGHGIAALQFYGGGTMGMNKNIVWLPRDEEPKMKLLLAAALTAVLQYKMENMEF